MSIREIKKLFKRIVRSIVGKDLLVFPHHHIELERFGSNHADWHLCGKLLTETSIVYSFGVGQDISFDLELIARYGVVVHAFDPTPRAIRWIKSQTVTDKFRFYEIGISSFNGEILFHPPTNPLYVSYTALPDENVGEKPVKGQVNRLETIRNRLHHDEIDLLKMDIEGSEYDVIEDLSTTEIRPHQILVEFHHRFSSIGVMKTRNAIKLMRGMGYVLVYVSPSGEEYSFIHGSTLSQS